MNKPLEEEVAELEDRVSYHKDIDVTYMENVCVEVLDRLIADWRARGEQVLKLNKQLSEAEEWIETLEGADRHDD